MDMVINTSKSSCFRVGPRHKINCNNITNSLLTSLSWNGVNKVLCVMKSGI